MIELSFKLPKERAEALVELLDEYDDFDDVIDALLKGIPEEAEEADYIGRSLRPIIATPNFVPPYDPPDHRLPWTELDLRGVTSLLDVEEWGELQAMVQRAAEDTEIWVRISPSTGGAATERVGSASENGACYLFCTPDDWPDGSIFYHPTTGRCIKHHV